MRTHDERLMKRCITLAKKGAGYVSPNPMVGCVIVKDGIVVGEGYHHGFGMEHAEIAALRSAGSSAIGADLYVNLEPCNHTGKTPPCTSAIIQAGIRRVMVGINDPNPNVTGGGIERLKGAGIEVRSAVLELECMTLNEWYLKNVTRHLPFVTLKIAQTLDGYIAETNGYSKWITGESSRVHVRRLRSNYDAVLVGAGTVRKDNPVLRSGKKRGNAFRRIILSASLDIPSDSHVLVDGNDTETIFISTTSAERQTNMNHPRATRVAVKYLFLDESSDGRVRIPDILKLLFEQGIYSVLIEGGGTVFSQFIQNDCVDELLLFIAPKLLGRGIPAFPEMTPLRVSNHSRFYLRSIRRFGEDILLSYRLKG